MPEIVPDLLIKYRNLRGWSQEELAYQAGLSTDTVHNLETGKVRNPHPNTIKKLSNALECQTVELIKGNVEYSELYLSYYQKVKASLPDKFDLLGHWIKLPAIKLNYQKNRIDNLYDEIKFKIDSDSNMLVIGDSGTGKTMLCLKLLKEYIEEFPTFGIPFYIDCNDIKKQIGYMSLTKAIMEVVGKFEIRIDSKYIFLIDGLNVIGRTQGQLEIKNEIVKFSNVNKNVKFLVTTQTFDNSNEDFGEFSVFRILKLEKQDVSKYLSTIEIFDTQKTADSFYLSQPIFIKSLFRIPIFLHIISTLLKSDKFIQISNLAELFEKYISFICGSREYHNSMNNLYLNEIIPFLAFNMCKNNQSMLTTKQFNKYIHEYKINEYFLSINEIDFKDVIITQFKLGRLTIRGNFTFLFQELQWYFAAIYMYKEKYTPVSIFNLLNENTATKPDLINSLKFLVGMLKAKTSKSLIHNSIGYSCYIASELFTWSSIIEYDAQLIHSIRKGFIPSSLEYSINVEKITLFLNKVIFLFDKSKIQDVFLKANILQYLGDAHLHRLSNEEAIACYNEALNLYENNIISPILEYISCHINLGNSYSNILDYINALKHYELAIVQHNDFNIEGYPSNATCYMNIGNIYLHKDNTTLAVKHFKIAISILKQNKQDNTLYFADCQANLGIAYINQLKYKAAFKCLTNAIQIFINLGFTSRLKYASCLICFGQISIAISDYKDAIEKFMQAKAIFEKYCQLQDPLYASCYISLAQLHIDNQNQEIGLKYLKKANLILDKISNPSKMTYPKCYIAIGTIFHQLKQYDNALEYYQKGIEILTDKGLELHPSIGIAYINIGKILFEIGKNSEANDNFQKAITIEKSNKMTSQPEFLEFKIELGFYYYDQNELDKAHEYLEIANKIFQDKFLTKSLRYATFLLKYSQRLTLQNDYQKKIELLRKARSICIEHGYPVPLFAQCSAHLAIVHSNLEEYQAAFYLLDSAIENLKRNCCQDVTFYAHCLMCLGCVRGYMGERKQAIENLNSALLMLQKSVGENHPFYIECLSHIKSFDN
ncbi:hypothetical protein BVY01_00690 [bacterium I07]|nr:hypothetical protein BVY01_00690 [bacterium I07]